EVAMDRAAEEGEIADDIEHFVPDEFVRVPQWFGGENGIVSNDYGIFEAPAFDQAIGDQEFDLFKETKGARIGQLALPGFGGEFDAVKLGEAALLIGTGASDFEGVIREQGHHGFTHLEFDGGGDRVSFAAFVLRNDSGALD